MLFLLLFILQLITDKCYHIFLFQANGALYVDMCPWRPTHLFLYRTPR